MNRSCESLKEKSSVASLQEEGEGKGGERPGESIIRGAVSLGSWPLTLNFVLRAEHSMTDVLNAPRSR